MLRRTPGRTPRLHQPFQPTGALGQRPVLATAVLERDAHLDRRSIFEHNRSVALAEWRQLAA